MIYKTLTTCCEYIMKAYIMIEWIKKIDKLMK